MQKANSFVRTMFVQLTSVGLVATILATMAVTVANAQAQALDSSPLVSTNQASFNYSTCTKDQNRDVLADITKPENENEPETTMLGFMPVGVAPEATTQSLNGDTVFTLVNSFRARNGLSAFEKDENLCQLAQARAKEAYDEIYSGKQLHSGLYNRNLPYWVTENAKLGVSEQEALTWWIGSPIHYRALISANKYSCGACYGNVCVQEFTSYIPK